MIRTLRTLLIMLLLASIAYQANAYYRYQMALEARPPAVRTTRTRAGELRLTMTGSGVLEPQQFSVVAARELQSTITDIVDDGVMVKAGQVVCRLDTTPILKDLHDRQNAYATAEAQVASTQSDVLLNLNNAQTKAKKAVEDRQLLLTTNHATTESDQAQLQYNQSDKDEAQRQYDRKAALAKDQLVPEQDAETAGLNVQSKQVNIVSASKQLEAQQQAEKIGTAQGDMLVEDAQFSEQSAQSKAREQVENAKYNALQAKRQLELSQMQLQWCTVKSPISGLAVVERTYDESMDGWRPLRNGDQVFPSRRLMAIIDTSQMIVQADVGEIDIGHVRAGQPARVFPRAAPGLALRARVKSVSEVATSPPVWRSSRLPGKKVFRVVLTVLDARPELLRPEMTADFELIEATYPRSVLVPIEAVFPGPGVRGQAGTHAVGDGVRGERDASGAGLAGADGKGHSVRRAKTARVAEGSGEGVVYVLRDGRYWPRKVKLGTRNDNDFQVLKGLRKGETIAIEPPPASLIGPPPQRTSGQKLGGLPGALSSLLSWRPGA